jgi:FkbM family methyltransferase
MQLKQLVGEHTIDVDLLPEEPLVLDVGCRYFNFCEEVLALRPKARVIALDPAPDVGPPSDPRITFLRLALIETEHQAGWLKMDGIWSWTAIKPQQNHSNMIEISIVNLREVMSRYGSYFDLIKFDCEGSEYGTLENWPGPCAGQVNIEFHDLSTKEDVYFDRLFAEKLPDYRVILNSDYIDVLLALK